MIVVFRQARRPDHNEDGTDSPSTNQGRRIRFLHEGDGRVAVRGRGPVERQCKYWNIAEHLKTLVKALLMKQLYMLSLMIILCDIFNHKLFKSLLCYLQCYCLFSVTSRLGILFKYFILFLIYYCFCCCILSKA